MRMERGIKRIAYALIFSAGLVSLFAVYFYEHYKLSKIGLPLDDSYIHLQYARNLVQGKWFVYIAGDDPTPGDTSPLWVILIAGLGLVYKNLIAGSLILGGIFYLLTGMMAYLIGARFFKDQWLALIYGLVVIFTGRLLWGAVSGMEVTLFSFLSLLGVWLYFRDKERGRLSALCGAIFGLASNARPEGHLLFLFVLLDWVIVKKIIREKRFKISFIPWAAGITYLLLAIPYPLFCYFTVGHLTPNSFWTVSPPMEWGTLRDFIKKYLTVMPRLMNFDNFLVVYLALPVGAGLFLVRLVQGSEKAWNNFLLLLWPFGYLVVHLLLTPMTYQFQRYLIPVLPFFVLISFSGWHWLLSLLGEWLGRKYQRWILVGGLLVLVVLGMIRSLYLWPRITTLCVKNIEEMQVTIGYWFKKHTPPQTTIATNDIGAISYFSERRVVDTVGLVNPALLERILRYQTLGMSPEMILFQHLLEEKPDYLVIFPNWYPVLAQNQDYLEKVFSIVLTDNLICGGNEMVVYKGRWDKK